MGLRSLINKILDLIFGGDGDQDDSYGAPRGEGWDPFILNTARNAGHSSVDGLKRKDPALYKRANAEYMAWVRAGLRYSKGREGLAIHKNRLSYNRWLQSEPGLPNPRKIVTSGQRGAVWRYEDEPASAWKRAH